MSAQRILPRVEDPEAVCRATLTMPLERIFSSRVALIHPVVDVRDQEGEWGSATGQTRTVETADGNTLRETLLSVEPQKFTYRLDEATGPLGLVVAEVEGSWEFARRDSGVQVTWTWVVDPTNDVAQLVAPVFRLMWERYAGRSLARLGMLLDRPA